MHILRRIPYYGFWALLIYMPFHIFLSQSLSLTTGGLEVWKVAKDVVLVALVLFTICLVWLERKGSRLFNWLVGLTVVYALAHGLVWLMHPDIFTRSALIGFVYNMRLPAFLLLGYGATLLNPGKFVFSSLFKVIVGLGTAVALLGLVQYFLPKDILLHLGYGLERGTRAAFFIDDNPALPRIMSTLREPNALGAYLIVPMCMIVAVIGRVRTMDCRALLAGLLTIQGVALVLTQSRSAWLAAALSLTLVVWWHYREPITKVLKRFWWVGVTLVVVLAGLLVLGRDSSFVQHYFTHSTEEVVMDLDSNDYHALLLRQGIDGVADQPFGHGPGTAGLASIQNPNGGQLTENYYVQIAYEVGVLGLLVFVTLNVLVYLRLWRLHTSFAGILLAAFWGYVLMNMLLHTWSNEAVAAQWWLLAGVAMALVPEATKPSGRTNATKKRAAS